MKNIKEKLIHGFLYIICGWAVFALTFDVFMMTLHYANPKLSTKIGNEIMWKMDGTFKNDPNNIWYEKK